jgi:outer membrane protein TolC
LQSKRLELKRSWWIIACYIGLLGWSPAFGESQTLSLSQAVEMACQADYQVKTDRNSLEKSKLAVKKAALNILPQATVEGQYQYQTTDDTYPSAYQIVVQQTIPTTYNLYGQKIVSNIEAAMWEQVTAEATLQIDQAEVIYNTYEYYFTVLKAQQVLKLHEAALAKYKEDHALATKLLSLGKITKPDQLKTQNSLNQAEFDVEKDRSDLDIAKQKLANQLGLKDLSNYQFAEVNFKEDAINEQLAALQQKALQRRLELQKKEIVFKQAQRTWAQTKNEEMPAVSVSYNDQDQTQSFGLSYDFLSGDFSWLAAKKDNSYQSQANIGTTNTDYYGSKKRYFTLKFNWSLDFGTAANQTKQAQYTLDNAKLDLERERQNILLDVSQTFSEYQLAVKQHELNQKALPYYDKDLEIKEVQRQFGSITFADLSDARQDALDARIAAVKSGYDRVLALQKLKKALGDLYLFDQKADQKAR